MHIIGERHDVVTFGTCRYWAERGQIHIEDSRDNSYRVDSVRTVLERMAALSEMLGNSKEKMRRAGFMDSHEYHRIQGMLEAMTTVCKKAQEQGMPSDPTAVRDAHRRLPKTVLMPAMIPAF